MKRLIIVALFTTISIGAYAQTQGSFFVDVGVGFGTKHGLGCVLGLRYFVRDGWSVDIYGTLPVEMYGQGGPSIGPLGVGLETSYFPEFAKGWLYVNTGLSFLFTLQQRTTSAGTMICLNSDIGSNSPRFDGKVVGLGNGLHSVYGELGLSRVLLNSNNRETDSATPVPMSSGSWWFPNVEIGLRTGSWSW